MNTWQMAYQLRHILRNHVWPDGSGDPVFGAFRVKVVTAAPTPEQMPMVFPHCMIAVPNGNNDPDSPRLLSQSFNLYLGQSVTGDPLGEFAMIGGSITDRGKSVGRGILEIQEEVFLALGDLTGADGSRVLVSAQAPGGPFAIRANQVVIGLVSLQAIVGVEREYTAPQLLRYSVDDGAWSWDGAACSSRFDFWRYKLLQKAGTSPSANTADGTLLYTGTTPSFVTSSAAGNTYTVFCEYDGRGSGILEGTSSPVRGAYSVVTA